ncbi:MAG: hypothetical protein J6Y01_00910 [Spirochaetales bacterium]|nr:hypothetical protein [Spirochaetales bacterium]
MKKSFAIICVLLTVSVIFAQTRVAVLPFTADDYDSRSQTTYLTEVFTVALCSSGKYTVLERLALDKIITEMRLQNSDDFDESTAAEIGKLAGTQQIFLGNVYRLGKGYGLSLRCVDIQTGAITFAKKGNARNLPELEMVTKKIAAQINSGNIGTSDVNVGLTKNERKFSETYLRGKWGIYPTNQTEMKTYFNRHFISGLALAGTGATFLTVGLIITPVLCSQTKTWTEVVDEKYLETVLDPVTGIAEKKYKYTYEDRTAPDETCVAVGASLGTLLILGGLTMLPVSIIPLLFSKRIWDIYHKSTGEKLLTTFTGGYNWERKELTLAMNIKF